MGIHGPSITVKVIPSGEASYRHEPSETEEGQYYAMSYRRKRVCIDSGIVAILQTFVQELCDSVTGVRIDTQVAKFLSDYPMVWWKNPHGEFLEIDRITASFVKSQLVLTPHYKVPNEVRNS